MTISWETALQILAVMGGLGSLFAWVGSNLLKGLREEFEVNAACRHDNARRLTSRRWWGLYRWALAGSLERLNSWMGKPEAWWQTFHWCLACAFVYPMLALFLTWTFGVDAAIGDTELLIGPDQTALWRRATVLLVIVSAALAILFNSVLFAKFDKLGTLASISATISSFVAMLVMSAVTGAVALAGIVGIALACTRGFDGPAGFATGVALVVILTIWSSHIELDGVQATAIILFWLLLPLLNAVFDWISWQVSRRLGRHLLRQLDGVGRSWSRQLWDNPVTHMVVDVLAAGFLLAGLAWALPAVIRQYNRLIESLGSSAPLVLDGYLCDAARDPFGASIWATVMLISTLVPTLIHLGFVFASPFIAMFKPHPVWDARAAHLEGRGLPPAVDLRGMQAAQSSAFDPASSNPGLGEPGKSWLPPLHPETTKAVAWELRVAQPVLQLMMITAAALLLLNLVLAWDHIWTPVPAWLLWAAHGFDELPVQQCLGVWL